MCPSREFIDEFNDVIPRLPTLINATGDVLNASREQPVDAMIARLEVHAKNWELTNAQYMLVYTWMLATDFDGLDWSRRELIEESPQLETGSVADVLELLDTGRLGAWRLERTGGRLTAVPVDGNPATDPVALQLALDNEFRDVAHGHTYAGWVAELNAGHFMFFASRLSDDGLQTLQQAVERSAWGRGDAFRRDDYREDVLAVVVNDGAGHLEYSDSRTIIGPEAFEDRDELRDDFLEEVLTEVFCEGPPINPWRRRRSWRRLGNWSQRAARAVDEQFEELLEQLQDARLTVARRIWEYYFGWRTLRALLSDEVLLASIQLTADGSVDHPATRRRNQYPVAVLDLDEPSLEETAICRDWTVDHALRWARANLDEPRLIRIENEAFYHHIAMRWVGIVDLHRRREDPIIPRISYRDLRSSILSLLPPWAGETPVEQLDDPGRGTWRRITEAMREAGDLEPDEPLRIENLPSTVSQMHDYSGVAGGTSSNITEALQRYVADWPDSAGYRPVCIDDETDEGRDDIEAGLDELDDLF